MELGSWRIQVSPKRPAAENVMLNVIQVTDWPGGRKLPVERVDAGLMVGCRIHGPDCDWGVLFRRDGRRGEEPVSPQLSGDELCRILITDLDPGTWQAIRAAAAPVTLQVEDQTGAAWLQGRAGAWRLSKVAE